jgi:UDP-N-acetylglucosamine 2-epimerase (non-hydrolysing)
MTKKKVMMVFGTRPEAIKMAPLYYALKQHPDEFDTLLCVTAQHRQMLDQVLQVFSMAPDIDLNLMKPGQDLFDVTVSVLLGMRMVLHEHKPDILLVHGDTTTAIASAIAGLYLGVPVGHVEAGLRTHDISAPFPEEFNRQVITKAARWHFAPTDLCFRNLLAEGVDDAKVTVTGNTVIDALFLVLNRIESDAVKRQAIHDMLSEKLTFDFATQRFVLITGHRRENFGDGFLNICSALRDLAERFPEAHFVYPVHLNPNVQEPVTSILAGLANVHLIAPLDYEPFVYLLKHCHIVITDSGGIQEEAPSLGKPVLVMRDVTERPEAVNAGTVRLVGANRDKIVSNAAELLDDELSYKTMTQAHNPYGDGQASERIVSVLRKI